MLLWVLNDCFNKGMLDITTPSHHHLSLSPPKYIDPFLEHIFSHLVQLLLRVLYILSTENHSVPVVINKKEKRKWLGWVSLAHLYNASNICHRWTGRLPRRHGTNNKNNKVVCYIWYMKRIRVMIQHDDIVITIIFPHNIYYKSLSYS